MAFPARVIARRGRVRDPLPSARVQAVPVEGFRADASLDRDGRAGDISHARARGPAAVGGNGKYCCAPTPRL